jgi:hypothetical protein
MASSGEPAEGDDDANDQLLYAIDSFTAVLKPVSISMVLASIVVTAFQNDSSSSGGGLSACVLLDRTLSSTCSVKFLSLHCKCSVKFRSSKYVPVLPRTTRYTVYAASDSDATSVRLEKSFANSLIIVSVLAVATFGIVGLYKFRCTKVLVGYMMLSSVLLLGVMGGVLIWTTFDRFQIPCDSATFLFACYNFGVVGVVSIFYQAGVPTFVTQSYLVATSVLMAWQLSHFEEWTGWCLLVTLAAYDLCAVLTPCGPLKALVSLMQERGEPMPGLLYEAALPAKASDKAASFVSPGTHDPHYAAVGDGGAKAGAKAGPPPGTAAPSGAATFGGGEGGRGGASNRIAWRSCQTGPSSSASETSSFTACSSAKRRFMASPRPRSVSS